jgi:UDP-glucuronate 4-epimerase
MKILVTGSAGFIGFHVTKKLAGSGFEITAIDSINSYYDVQLKLSRLNELGISSAEKDIPWNKSIHSSKYQLLSFIRTDLSKLEQVEKLFQTSRFDVICHLAAQPGVRYSIINPAACMENNITAFFNLINIANSFKPDLFLYASSSSVYGNSTDIPFSIESDTDHPVSFYAATKKANELLAHTYSHIHSLKTIGLRFFTVYGPWGRPDMAYFSFTENILTGKPITLYNNGNLKRDFTYVDDIADAVYKIAAVKGSKTDSNYKIYNVGNHESIELSRFVKAIESATGKQALIEYLPMQPGDVYETYADIENLSHDYSFKPVTNIEKGIASFVEWYKTYYKNP